MSKEKRELVAKLVKEGLTSKQISIVTGLKMSSIRYYRECSKFNAMIKKVSLISTHRVKIKMKAVDYSGGRCLKCGYSDCIDCIVFHHLDPKIKESKVISGGYTLSWAKVKFEADKTILLCNRCHTELHAGHWKLDNELIKIQEFLRSKYIDKDLVHYEVEIRNSTYRNQHSLLRSSMVEQSSVKAEVAGSSPAEAAIKPPQCIGEKCSICGKQAYHKIGEEIFGDDNSRHNLTAYVCTEHFNQIMDRNGWEKWRGLDSGMSSRL